jgi:hypothetical protein
VLPHQIAVGTHRLAIDFTGKINNFGRGLFKVDYPTGDGPKRMIATHSNRPTRAGYSPAGTRRHSRRASRPQSSYRRAFSPSRTCLPSRRHRQGND